MSKVKNSLYFFKNGGLKALVIPVVINNEVKGYETYRRWSNNYLRRISDAESGAFYEEGIDKIDIPWYYQRHFCMNKKDVERAQKKRRMKNYHIFNALKRNFL